MRGGALIDPVEACRAAFGPESCTAGTVRASLATSWDERLQADFVAIEHQAFRDELRYTREEMITRSRLPGFECLLIHDGGGPAAVLIIYDCIPESTGCSAPIPLASDAPVHTIYLDVIAVRTPGAGVGSRLLGYLIRRCELVGARAIVLDTERFTEKGFELVAFYRRFGFTIVGEDEKSGNITMRRELVSPDAAAG